MTAAVKGPLSWSMSRDAEGHREYKIVHLVACSTGDGPATALNCPGLPQTGETWQFDSDIDVWAWCRANKTVTPVLSDEPNPLFKVESTYSTKPPDASKSRCQDTHVEDPLLEPAKVSGSFNKYTQEAYASFAGPIVTSSWEQVRGPQVEFDRNRMQIKIEQNVPTPYQGYVLPSLLIDYVNLLPIWGFPPRTVKLSSAPWERKFYGSCYAYYTRTLEFDINPDTFDRVLVDEGTKVLNGHWAAVVGSGTVSAGPGLVWVTDPIEDYVGARNPDPYNPTHFVQYQDPYGNPGKVLLDGRGQPWVPYPPVAAEITSPSTSAGSPTLVDANVEVGPFTLNGGVSHYFTVFSGTGFRRVIKARLTPIDFPSPDAFNSNDLIMTVIGTDAGSYGPSFVPFLPGDTIMLAGTSNAATTEVEVSNTGSASTQYYFKIEGKGRGAGPGQIPVVYYPAADLTVLGVPLEF